MLFIKNREWQIIHGAFEFIALLMIDHELNTNKNCKSRNKFFHAKFVLRLDQII